MKLPHAGSKQLASESCARRHGRLGTTAFDPFQGEPAGGDAPRNINSPGRAQKRAVFRRVRRELMKDQRQQDRNGMGTVDVIAVQFKSRGTIRRKFTDEDLAQGRAAPSEKSAPQTTVVGSFT